MTTIYVVTSGQYSDYSIRGVFTTKENAQAYINAFSAKYSEFNDVEEYELDQWVDEISRGLIHWRVIMYRDGSLHEVEKSEYPGFGGDFEKGVHWMDRAYWNPTQPWANFYVWSETQEAAIKIANERRIMALAAESPERRNCNETGSHE